MESRTIVYNAARDGKLYRLRNFLDHRPPEEVNSLVSAVSFGSTPLVIACRNGHLEVVRYLIEKCHADIEQVGAVTFDGDMIEDAPPLWCAAAAGHYNLVRTLINYNAFVNSTTKTNSTPLRAACYDGHFEIAKYLIEHGADIEIANKLGHTCLMIACFKGHLRISEYLIQCGADVNRKSVRGNTALHDCAESGSLEILQLLLCHGAVMDADSRGMTPLLSAAVTGQVAIVEYIINSTPCAKYEQIEALELLGATFMDKKRDMARALDFWRRAMRLRYEDNDAPLLKPCYKSPIGNYINATEVSSFEQLEELMSDPDAMRMQALLIRERILGPAHPDTAYYIRYRGAAYADTGNFDRCIQLWMYALDVQQNVLEPLSPMTTSSLLSFTELFSYMMSDAWSRARIVSMVAFNDIMSVLQRAVKEMKTALAHPWLVNPEEQDENIFHRTLNVAMHLIGLMCKLQPRLSKDEDFQMKQLVYQMVRMNPRGRKGWTPLHIACFKDDSSFGRYPVFSFPSADVVELLLEVGSCPNAVDFDGNTPLHIAAMNRPSAKAVFKALLNRGAHLDLRNKQRQTPLQLSNTPSSLDVYPLQHMNLQCLCASVVRDLDIPFRGIVPRKVETFLEAH